MMTLPELRGSIPVLRDRAYLFSGGIAPLADPVAEAMNGVLEAWRDDPGGLYADLGAPWAAGRAAFASIVGATADEIALTDGTSRGSNLIAQMVDVPAGGNVVVDDYTYWSSRLPWTLRTGESRREVRHVRCRADHRVHLDDLAAVVDDRTALVSVTHVSWQTGFRHDLAALAEIAHGHGALLAVDFAQSAGAVEIDVHALGVDLGAGLAMKWLLGSPGVGWLYVRKDLQDSLPPAHVSYAGLANLFDEGPDTPPVFHPTAARYEIGIPDIAGVAGSVAGIDLLEAVGMAAVERQVLDLSAQLIDGLLARGIEVLTPPEESARAGVVSCAVDDGADRVARLRAVGVDTWTDGRVHRIDPHAFNTSADIDRTLEGIDSR